MTIKQALISMAGKLKESRLITPSLDAEILLSFILKKPKPYIYTYPEKQLTKQQEKRMKILTEKRKKQIPVAYLIGYKEFFKLKILVNRSVLIPRPETEILVQEAIKIINKDKKIKTIADIGCGSGAIAVSLSKNINSKINVYATDIYKRALLQAEKNSVLHDAKIHLLFGDLLEPLAGKKIDIMVANLPYLQDQEKNLLKSSASAGLKYEPQKALFSGKDGLSEYKRFFQQLKKRKNKPKFALIEFGSDQTEKLKKVIKKNLPNTRIEIIKDLCGLDRVAKIKIK